MMLWIVPFRTSPYPQTVSDALYVKKFYFSISQFCAVVDVGMCIMEACLKFTKEKIYILQQYRWNCCNCTNTERINYTCETCFATINITAENFVQCKGVNRLGIFHCMEMKKIVNWSIITFPISFFISTLVCLRHINHFFFIFKIPSMEYSAPQISVKTFPHGICFTVKSVSQSMFPFRNTSLWNFWRLNYLLNWSKISLRK